MGMKLASGPKGGVPPFKEGQKIDLTIAHWCLFGPHLSGMYETTRELITAENQIEGVLAGMCEVPSPTSSAKVGQQAAQGGKVDPMHPYFRTQDYGWALKFADVHVIHTSQLKRVGELKQKAFFIHGCFYREQLIHMADGSCKPIHSIREGDMVLSYNHQTSMVEPKKVLCAGKNGVSSQWIRLELEHGPLIMATKDHPIFLPDGSKCHAGNIKIGDTIAGVRPVLSEVQREIILGKVMGDGHFHHHGLEWSHKVEHSEYIDIILNLFKGFTCWRAEQPSGFGTPMKRVRISLGTGFRGINPLEEIKKLCYEGKTQSITDEWLNGFTWLSLAVLYYDDGSLVKQHYEKSSGKVSEYNTAVNIAMCQYEFEDVEKIAKHFSEKFDLSFKVTNYDYPRLALYGKENLNKFFSGIVSQLPIADCMKYKIPEEYHEIGLDSLSDELHFESFNNKVIGINEKAFPKHRLGSEYTRWALTVEDNHNYYAGNNLVSNTPEACLELDLQPGADLKSYESAIGYIDKSLATFVTSERAKFFWQPYDYTGKRIHKVNKGIDLEWWQRPTTTQNLPGDPSVLYGEIWRGIKHPMHTIFAVNEIYKEHPDVKLNVWGNNIKREFWQKVFAEGNFNKFLGPQGIRGIIDYPEHYYARGDVLVSPGLYGDASRVGQEALACGCPVVGWDSDPYRDTHPYKYAKSYDCLDLADKILETHNEVLDDPLKVQDKCREIAVKYFNVNDEARQVVDTLRRALSEL